jgi:hypothetical protein
MARAATPESEVERLVQFLFDGDLGEPLAGEIAGWLGQGRFRAFVEENRDKIRKKLRGAVDAEARRDVRAELGAARLLLADRRIELGFEAYGSGKLGPDFTVGFHGERRFNLEVTRLRGKPDDSSLGGHLLAKLRQLPPSLPNGVIFAADKVHEVDKTTGAAGAAGAGAGAVDFGAVSRSLRARADRKDEAFFVGRGFAGTRDFYDRFLRLGIVLVWAESGSGEGRASLWTNRSARIELPPRAARACLACLRADD